MMASSLAQARCFKHVDREAVAKCPECGRFYCRECVTEHEGRVVCRSCLDALLAENEKATPGWIKALGEWALAGVGGVIAVYAFYLMGRILLRIPSQFHSGGFFN